MSLLKIEHLSVTSRDRDTGREKSLVKDVSLEIGQNEIFGLVGESGSGKTMTALSVLRLLPPGCRVAEGKIFWKEKNIFSLETADLIRIRGREIALVFQDPFTAFNPVIPLGQQIAEVLQVHFQMRPQAVLARVPTLLAQVHLSEPGKIMRRYPFELSGGQLQRAAIAMALAAEPKLLIADEPTTALDVVTQFKILNLIKEIQGQFKMSVLFISHDLSLVRYLADRVAVMNQGRVVEIGQSQDIFNNPQDSYTQKLISSIPVLRRF